MIENIKLENNLQIVFEKIPSVRSVCFGIWVKNGSRNESAKVNGISHFIEHMLFKGTEKLSARDIADKMDAVGGQLNAFTSKEYTCYYARVLDTHFDVAIDVLTDMFLNSKFDNDEINKERNVIMEEINMYEDTPEDLAHDLIHQCVWRDDSLGFPVLGTKESISTFNHDIFVNYFNRNYYPENTVLAVAGNFDRDKILEKLSDIFKDYGRKNPYQKKKFKTAYTQGIITKVKDIEQVHMIAAFPGVGMGSEDSYKMAVLNTIFGGGMSSRLFQAVREESGLAYSVYSFNSSFADGGLLSIYAGLNKNQAPELIDKIINEIKKLNTNKITEEDLAKTKEQLKSNYVLSLESTTSRMNAIGRGQLMLNKVLTPEEVIEKIDKVSIADLYELTEKTFDFDQMSICAVGNVDGLDFQEMIQNAK
ncbi:M16 family metallopeptidase [Anaeropeptidivorans aminofermentans]|jgi:predicted Zn-dependent peptidase|uniref:M16 family metallopeptidase n=1 Tax=Anaeropeptidivorans aminofermentans TaxID=2934315 RepID=UPI002024A231|nr:pitrilysin family protein [Anaeropeptidivorans aminofermentans]MBE6013407.1 insulinase family protein [Lachnospiraceae bacterium]